LKLASLTMTLWSSYLFFNKPYLLFNKYTFTIGAQCDYSWEILYIMFTTIKDNIAMEQRILYTSLSEPSEWTIPEVRFE